MNMLTPYQLELIHSEVDGENTPEASVEVRKLVETQPEALALMTSLRGLDALFRKVPDRALPPRVIQLIRNAMPLNSRTSPRRGPAQGTTQAIPRWVIQQWNGVTNLMEESMLTKKMLIIATTAVAAIAIIGQAVVGYSPSVFDAATIGAGDSISGVQQAGRYKGRAMSEADVTLSNPQIYALFQNDQVLRLVKSDVFREAMRNDAFRELQSSDAFHQLMSSEAYQQLMSSEAYQQLMSSEANQQLMSSEANQQLMSGEAFREVMKSDAYREVMANDAYRQLQSNDMFRALSRSQSLSEAFLNQAMRAPQ